MDQYYLNEKLPNEPIVTTWMAESMSVEAHGDLFIEEFVALLDSLQESVFYISDLSNAGLIPVSVEVDREIVEEA